WRGSIIKISIWSEGLAKLNDKPSQNWIGQWVSVTGLLDPPYHSARYGYTHLIVTVQEDGQIQHLQEKQALFRLTKIGKETKDASSAATGAATSQGARTTSGGPKATGGKSKNQEIFNKYKAPPQQPTWGTTASSGRGTIRGTRATGSGTASPARSSAPTTA